MKNLAEQFALACIVGIVLLSAAISNGQDLYFVPSFDVDVSESWAYAHARADLDGDFTDESPSPPRSKGDYYLDLDMWTTSLAEALAQSSVARGEAWAEISVQWVDNIFTSYYYLMASAQGTHTADVDWTGSGEAEAQLVGTARLQIDSTTYPDGFPFYVRILGNGGSGTLHNATVSSVTKDTYRLGPAWSAIKEYLPGTCHRSRSDCQPYYTLAQMGDIMEFHAGKHCYGSAVSSSMGSPSEVDWSDLTEVDARPMESGEYEVSIFGDPVVHRRHFTAGKEDWHSCAYAVMAMIVDYWAHKYPQLYDPDQDDPNQEYYYKAFDELRDPSEYALGMDREERLKILQAYFDSRKAPLAATKLTPGDFSHPVMLHCRGVSIGDEVEPGHVVVVDGIFRCKDHWSETNGFVSWLAVRDTWGADDLDYVMSLDRDESLPGRYRGFMYNGYEWWPSTDLYDEQVILYFPFDEYRCKPLSIDGVIESPKVRLKTLSEEYFSCSWELLTGGESFSSYSADPNASITVTVVGDPNEEEEVLYMQAPNDLPFDLLFYNYVTARFQISFDYTLSESASLELWANDELLDSVSGGGVDTNNLSHYARGFDMNETGLDGNIVDFTFKLTGPPGKELYLDNLILENPDAFDPSADIDGDGV